jgi:kynurenine formamidase
MCARLLLSTLLAAAIAACNGQPAPDPTGLRLPSTNVVDLTHPFNEETIYWPTEDGFEREVTVEGMTEDGYFYASGHFSTSEHGGTHLDAPIHFAEGTYTVDEIPLNRLMGPAVVIDGTQEATANPDFQIESADLLRWESQRGPIPDGSIVLFRTGFGRFWPDRGRYLGTDEHGSEAVANLRFPGLHPDAASWLVENRAIHAVGIDTPSIDYGQSRLFETHRILFRENIPAFENVANLDRLPSEGSVVVALPMKIEGGSGAPLRIIAFVP